MSLLNNPNSCLDWLAIIAMSVKSSLGLKSLTTGPPSLHFLMNHAGFNVLARSVARPARNECDECDDGSKSFLLLSFLSCGLHVSVAKIYRII